MVSQFRNNRFSTTSIKGSNVVEEILPVKKYEDIEPCENSVPTYNDYPDSIEFELDDKVNILYIHSIIRSKLIYDKCKHGDLCRNISKIEQLPVNNDITAIKNSRELTKLKKELSEINITFWEEYISTVSPIFDKFIIIRDKNNKLDCLKIIKQYINIVKKLEILDINMYYSDDSINECPFCGDILMLTNDEQKCSTCGFYDEKIYIMDEQQDVADCYTPKTDLVLKPFQEWINRFLGISNETFPEKLMFKKFDDKCIELGYPTGDLIRNGTFPQPKLQLLIDLMQETKYSAYYKIKNKIRHEYWGWPLPVLSDDQISRMCDDYIKTQNFYPTVAIRKQNLNTEIRGYYHVRAVGLEISTSDFKFPGSTDESKIDANNVWRKCCEGCNVEMHLIHV